MDELCLSEPWIFMRTFFDSSRTLQALELQLNPERRIVVSCQVWLVQTRTAVRIALRTPGARITPPTPTHSHFFLADYESYYSLPTQYAYSSHALGMGPHDRVPVGYRALFITDFEYGPHYFHGHIGLLFRAPGSFSFLPWCPSYPSDLFDAHSDVESHYEDEDAHEHYLYEDDELNYISEMDDLYA